MSRLVDARPPPRRGRAPSAENKISVRYTQRSFYRSMLRAKVRALDAKLGKRSFGDKREWQEALEGLQQEIISRRAY